MVLIWRYISLASICASLVFPVVLVVGILASERWNFASLWPLLIAATAIPLLVLLRHRANIHRLRAGTEAKIRRKPPAV
jgi:glycerol-3-phosphate acyltransferase PlsY